MRWKYGFTNKEWFYKEWFYNSTKCYGYSWWIIKKVLEIINDVKLLIVKWVIIKKFIKESGGKIYVSIGNLISLLK